MSIKELGHIVLYVRDVQQSRRFYGEVLGWKEIPVPEATATWAAFFSSGRSHHELMLRQVAADAAPIPEGHRVGVYHIGLKVGETDDELREVRASLQAAGVRILDARDHGVTHSLYVEDPDGNEIELYIDVQPALWKDDPRAVVAPTRPLQL